MNETTATAAAHLKDAATAPTAEWRDDYKAADKTTRFREDWEALLGAINPRFARHGRAASIIWPLSVLTLGVALIVAFSSGINWHTLPLKSAVLVLTIGLASQYWPHRIVRYFNLDGHYPRPVPTITAKERRLRLLYKVWVGLLAGLWVVIAFVFATSPVTPDTPAEGRVTTVVEMFCFLALLAFLPWMLRVQRKKDAAKEAKRQKSAREAIEVAPRTIKEAEERLEADNSDGHIYAWLMGILRFRYRFYGFFVPDDENSRRYRVRTWGSRNAHRRFVGPFARVYDWLVAWVLIGIGWLAFGSLGWAITTGWKKIEGFAKSHLWHWVTAHL